MFLSEIIVYAVFAYVATGFIFAIYFAFFGVKKFDESARNSGIGFSLIIFFGAVAFWALLVVKLFRGGKRPTESNAHRKIVEDN